MEPTHLKAILANAVGATATQSQHDISDFKYGSVQVTGTFVGSVQLQISSDGTTWVNLGAAIAAPALTELDLYSRYIRADVTWTSGSITAVLIAKR